MSTAYVCPLCGREYISPTLLSERPVPGHKRSGPTCSGSRSGGKHSSRVMVARSQPEPEPEEEAWVYVCPDCDLEADEEGVCPGCEAMLV